MPFSSHAMDHFVGTKMSEFTQADVPNATACSPEQEHWLSNFILNTVFRGTPPHPARQYMFHFLRRAEAAFREYELARSRTMQHLTNRDSTSHFVASITHWETYLAHSYIAYDQLRSLSGGVKLFEKNDGSVLSRLNLLYNTSKHAVEDQFPPDGTLAVWLENQGLRSRGTHLSFDEMHEILQDLATWADRIQDPSTLHAAAKGEAESDKLPTEGSD